MLKITNTIQYKKKDSLTEKKEKYTQTIIYDRE